MNWYLISTAVLPVVLAITVHEVAHGYVALRFGDDTAKVAGRLTLNPLAHIHPIGTILMPGLLLLAGLPAFGFAKPVPVDFTRLRHPKQDMVWVAAAGPGVNIAMALIACALLKLAYAFDGELAVWAGDSLVIALWVNIVLAVFNMIPLPPLDGGRVAVGLLPMDAARWLAGTERYGMVIIFGIILVPILVNDLFGTDFSILAGTILPVVEFLVYGLVDLFGIVGAD